MAIVSVMYPAKEGSRFDMDYYLNRHMTMVAETWSPVGLRGYTVLKGVRAPGGGEPVFQIVVNLDFESAAALRDQLLEVKAKGNGSAAAIGSRRGEGLSRIRAPR